MSLCLRVILVVALCVSQTLSVQAAVKLNSLFSDNAVLQQGACVPVWGTAADGEKVTVKIQGQVVTTTAASDGAWMVRLNPLKAGGPFVMVVSGENTVEIKNILVGEVWVCSGQSNMQLPLHPAYVENAQQAIDSSRDPMLRLASVQAAAVAEPTKDLKVTWVECGPDTVSSFSAAGYFFARDLRRALGVPVGMISSVWGGTIAEAWTSREYLESQPVTKQMLAERPPKNNDPNSCSALYNGMVYPLQPYAIKGVIWYQGESNSGDAFRYRTLFPTLIECWRKTWGQGDFPFLFVQLAPFGKIVTEPEESGLAELREAQLLTSKNTPNTAMVVITDYGDSADIHPKRKEPVGARLALAARALAYGENIVYQGPTYESMVIRGDRAVISFSNTDGGLVSVDGELTGWAIAGEDRKFVNARASIFRDRVVVSSPLVKHPVAVRFGWAECPVVNLFNKAGLPASPFRTDDFPMITKR